MRIVVHKYPLQIGTKVSITLPIGSKLVRCAFQGATPMLWVQKPLGATVSEVRHFNVYGTGWEIDEAAKLTHVDTMLQGQYVWHCYELTDE